MRNTHIYIYSYKYKWGFSAGSDDKESACNEGDPGLIPGKIPGKGPGNTLSYSCLENPMDRGAWQAISSTGSQSQTQLNGQHSQLQKHSFKYRF